METIELTFSGMAHGGSAIGREDTGRVVFVPLVIPGERAEVEIVEQKKRFARARLVSLLAPSESRVAPRCPHFGPCGGCQFQHIDYAAQLQIKEDVVRDQLERIGKMEVASVRPTLANPEPWAYAIEVHFGLSPDGSLGFWSPELEQVMPIETCHIIRPQLLELLQDVDLALPELNVLTLGVGDDGATMATLDLAGGDPPALEADFPVSAALILSDGRAVNLVGDNYLVRTVKGRDFRVTAGCFFQPSPPATDLLVDSVLQYAELSGAETVLELFGGVGTLTAFLAPEAADVTGVEMNPDAVADAAVNLDEFDNVALFEGAAEEILPLLELDPEVVVVDPPPSGLPIPVLDRIIELAAERIVYVSSEVATLARDGRRLAEAGYRLVEAQPLDMYPQTSRIQTVSAWKRGSGTSQ
jgi:23S rRNA (uracil1939-C5)-methyltransferase